MTTNRTPRSLPADTRFCGISVPPQQFFEGQLVKMNMDYPPYLKEGDTGIITMARPDLSGDDFPRVVWTLVGLFNGRRVRVQEEVLDEVS